jgi:DNA-binding transcriptional ArsR family regulator
MSQSSQTISAELLELVASRLRLLASPLRMRLLLSLRGREACVQELADELDACYQKISFDLNLLYRAGILARRPESQRVLYTLADYTTPIAIERVTASVTAHIEELSEIVTQSH